MGVITCRDTTYRCSHSLRSLGAFSALLREAVAPWLWVPDPDPGRPEERKVPPAPQPGSSLEAPKGPCGGVQRATGRTVLGWPSWRVLPQLSPEEVSLEWDRGSAQVLPQLSWLSLVPRGIPETAGEVVAGGAGNPRGTGA